MQTGEAHSSRHLVLSHLGFAYDLLVETNETFHQSDFLPFHESWLFNEEWSLFWNLSSIRLFTNWWLCNRILPHYKIWLFYQILGFHWAFAAGVARQQETLTPPDTWSRSIWVLHMFYLLRLSFSQTCCDFSGLSTSNIPRYFLNFA